MEREMMPGCKDGEKVLVIRPREECGDFIAEVYQRGELLLSEQVDAIGMKLPSGDNPWVREYRGANGHPRLEDEHSLHWRERFQFLSER